MFDRFYRALRFALDAFNSVLTGRPVLVISYNGQLVVFRFAQSSIQRYNDRLVDGLSFVQEFCDSILSQTEAEEAVSNLIRQNEEE